MKENLIIGGITVAPGEKCQHTFTVPGTENYTFPAVIINGKRDGKVFLATAGVHGAEYPGIQACIDLAEEIDPETVSGAVLLIPVVNTPAFYGRRAFVCPVDEENKNFNKVFPGSAEGTTADKVAYYITEEFIKKCNFHVDLHSGDIVEALEELCAVANTPDLELKAFITEAAKHTSFTHRINSGGSTEVYNRTAIDLGIPALLFERGGEGLLIQDEIDRNKADMISLMQFLEVLPGEAMDNSQGQIFYPRHHWGEAGASGCFYKYVDVGDEIKEGQVIGEIKDVFGNVLETITAKFDGRIKIANNTLGITKGDDTFMYGSAREE